MYNKKIMQHFTHPKNLGKMKNPSANATVGNPICGDLLTLYLKIKNGPSTSSGQAKIINIKFETLGCVAAIAVSSMVTEMAKGKTLDQASKLTYKDIDKELGYLPPVKIHCADLAIRALRQAIRDYKKKQKT